MSNSKISIITPAFIDTLDKRDWLLEMIDSVIEQTYIDWELIIVDDNSPMKITSSILKDERIRLLSLGRHKGPAIARNTAVAHATGSALYPVDADDILLPDCLRLLYNVFEKDPKKIVYGNLQVLMYDRESKIFKKDRVIPFPGYDFDNLLDFRGTIPVNAMHSMNCHRAAGGWKSKFTAGLEDLEYWIAAGKAGYCGVHIDKVIGMYRRHTSNRTLKMRHENQEGAMHAAIKNEHADVFGGERPMGCCAGSTKHIVNKSVTPNVAQRSMVTPSSPTIANVANVNNFSDDEVVWVQYVGPKNGTFGVVGIKTRTSYRIHGSGSVFKVHRDDLQRFKASGRGRDFIIGVSPPEGYKPEEKLEAPPAYVPPPIELDGTELEVMKEKGELIPRPANVKIEVEPSVQPAGFTIEKDLVLNHNLKNALRQNGWTFEKIALEGTEGSLRKIKGIGPNTEMRIIEEVKKKYFQAE